MKQVTGSNKISPLEASNSILSIQLVPDGLYFSVLSDQNKTLHSGKLIYTLPKGQSDQLLHIIYGDNPFLGYEYKKVNLIVDSSRITPVPVEWIDADNYADWLTYAGFLALPTESVIISRASEQMALVMPLDTASNNFLLEQYSDKLNYVHPLQILGSVPNGSNFIAVAIDGTKAYITAVEQGRTKCLLPLVFKGQADAIFCLHKLAAEFGKQPQIMFATTDKEMAKLLASQFKGAVNMNPTMTETPLYNVNNCRL